MSSESESNVDSFSFGTLGELHPGISTWTIAFIILFILCFDFFTGLLEFYLDGLPSYQRMIQSIYKELMQMGLTSLSNTIYNATRKQQSQELGDDMDFADVVLFFMAVFFVVHSFYIMGVSISSSKSFVRFNNKNSHEILSRIQKGSAFSFSSHLFLFGVGHLGNLKAQANFKIMHALFRDTSCLLPLDFDFSLYLSKCFEKFSMKTIENGVFSWFIFALLLILNFIRVSYNGPFVCSAQTSEGIHDISHHCYFQMMVLFTLCGAFICLYALGLYLLSEICYKRCLICLHPFFDHLKIVVSF
jgi:hypothetical protein